MIRIWPWNDAPAEYQALSQHGGDEDYVIEVSKADRNNWMVDSLIDRIDANGLGTNEVEVGDKIIWITAHA